MNTMEKNNERIDRIMEVLGPTPNWLVRNGILSFFLVFACLIIISFFFKYPEVITSKILITTENPPLDIISKVDGKIARMFINDQQQVTIGQTLAVIHNTANYDDVKKLQNKLSELSNEKILSDLEKIPPWLTGYQLGDIQNEYEDFKMKLKNYLILKHDKDYLMDKLLLIKKELHNNKQLLSKLKEQYKVQELEKSIYSDRFKRDSILFIGDHISKPTYELSRVELLDKMQTLDNSQVNISRAHININQIEQQILDFLHEKEKNEQFSLLLVEESIQNLKNKINQWEYKYILVSTISGKINFLMYWSENQNILAGEKIFSIIPSSSQKIIGKLMLPVNGAGEVQIGQKVNIRLLDYPYMEYGMLIGEIINRSEVPNNGFYILEIKINSNTTTNGITLNLNSEMLGEGDVILDKPSLLVKILKPLYFSAKNRFTDN